MPALRDLIFPPPPDTRVSAGLLIVRLVAGAAFILHGWGKIQNPLAWMGAEAPVPGVLQALAALSEFGGGIAWIVGLLTPLASFGLLCTMAVATLFHASKGDPFVKAGPGPGGAYEPALVFLTIAALLLLAGPGRFSVDALLFKSKGEDLPN